MEFPDSLLRSISHYCPGRSSRLYPVSATKLMLVVPDRSTVVHRCVGVQNRMPLVGSFFLPLQYTATSRWFYWIVCEVGSTWPYCCCFVECCSFKLLCRIHVSLRSKFFSISFVMAPMVHPYNSTVSLEEILFYSVREVRCLPCDYVYICLSIDEILLPIYISKDFSQVSSRYDGRSKNYIQQLLIQCVYYYTSKTWCVWFCLIWFGFFI